MSDVRKVVKKTGLPSGAGPVEKFMEQLERDSAARLRGLCDQAIKAGPPGGILRMRFDPSGERLYLGTLAGLRAFSWQDIANVDASLPEPAVRIDLAMPSGESRYCDGYVYDLGIDADNSRVLFAGGDGRLHFLEPPSGRSRVLLQPSGLPPIRRLALSRDRTALALILQADDVLPPRKARGPVLQSWDYRALSRAR